MDLGMLSVDFNSSQGHLFLHLPDSFNTILDQLKLMQSYSNDKFILLLFRYFAQKETTWVCSHLPPIYYLLPIYSNQLVPHFNCFSYQFLVSMFESYQCMKTVMNEKTSLLPNAASKQLQISWNMGNTTFLCYRNHFMQC